MTFKVQMKAFAWLLVAGLILGAAGSSAAQSELPKHARLRFGTVGFPHPDTVNTVLFPGDGKTLLSAGVGVGVIRWDLKTGAEVHRYTPQRELLAASPDGKTLAVRSTWLQVHLEDVAPDIKGGLLP